MNPSAGPAPDAVLAPRARVEDPGRVFRGRVVDRGGLPLRLAVVEPFALEAELDARWGQRASTAQWTGSNP